MELAAEEAAEVEAKAAGGQMWEAFKKIKAGKDECRRMEAADKESTDAEEWMRRNRQRLWYEKWNREWLEEANELGRRQGGAEAEGG